MSLPACVYSGAAAAVVSLERHLSGGQRGVGDERGASRPVDEGRLPADKQDEDRPYVITSTAYTYHL